MTGTAQGGNSWHHKIWLLAGPIILSNLSTPLLGAVDTAVVGHLPDPGYIGGVGVGAVLFSFLFWGFGFLRMGTTGFTAQAFGAGDTAELRMTLLRPLVLALALGSLLILLQTPIAWTAFALLDASAKVEGYAAAYYDIRIWSAPAVLVNYTVVGWLFGTQRTGTALLLQIVLNGLNILLDLVFVLGLGWDIRGVALASAIAEVTAAVLGLAILLYHLRGGGWDWQRLWKQDRMLALFKVNVDIFLRTLCLIGAFAYFTDQGAQLGDLELAGNQILIQFQHITAYGLDGFAHAAEILAGSALGARDRSAFRQVAKISGLWALGTAVIFSLVFLLAGGLIVAVFTKHLEVRLLAAAYLPWVIVSPLVSVWSFQLDGIFIGATRTAAMRNAMVISLGFYLLAAEILVPWLGNHGLWLALTLFMAARAITLGAYYPALERSLPRKPV